MAVRRAGSSGNGSMVPEARPRGQVNTATCPECGAKRGESCFIMTDTRFVELSRTHTGRGALKGTVKSAPVPARPEEEAQRRRSTPLLDARYAERKRREAAARRKANGL